jgi:hypothetical protein
VTSALVGAARIEITGDLAAFADRVETEMKGSLDAVKAIVDEKLVGIEARFGEAGSGAGTAFSQGATTRIVAGSQAAVAEGGARAAETAKVEFGAAGREAGSAFETKAKETMHGLGASIFAGVGAIGVAEVAKKSVEAADQLEGANIKIEGAFGESAKSVEKWAGGLAQTLGQSQIEAEQTAGKFGQMFHAMGIAQPQAAQMAEKMDVLAINVAKFNNADPQSVQDAFTAAMRGRGKALMALGINMDATTVAAEALKHHIIDMNVDQTKVALAQDAVTKATAAAQKVNQSAAATDAQKKAATDALAKAEQNLQAAMGGKLPVLTASQKAQASYYAILDGTKNQENAVSATSHTLAQEKRVLTAEVSNLEAKLGQFLLPVLASVAGVVTRDVVPAIQEFGHWINQNKDWIEPLAIAVGVLAAGFLVAKTALGAYQEVVRVGKGIHDAYTQAVKAVQTITNALGITQKATADAEVANQGAISTAREATATKTATALSTTATAETDLAATSEAAATRQNLALESTATSAETASSTIVTAEATAGAAEDEGAAGSTLAASEHVAASATVATAAEGTAATVQAAEAIAITAEEEGAAASAAAAAKEVASYAAVGAAADEAAAQQVAAAGAGAGAGAGGAAKGLLAGAGPVLAITAAVVGLGVVINKFDGEAGRWKNLQNINSMFGDNTKAAKTFSDAITADNNVLGTNTITLAATSLQQQGIADSAAKAGINLDDLTRGITGNDSAFQSLMQRMHDSGQVSNDTMTKYMGLRKAFEDGTTSADGLDRKAQALNNTLHDLSIPTNISINASGNADAEITKAHTDLMNLDGKQAKVYIAATVTTNGVVHSGPSATGQNANVQFYAAGGKVDDGTFVVGERGAEIMRKMGPDVEVINNADSMRALASGASGGAVTPGARHEGGGMSRDEIMEILESFNNRPVYLLADRQVLARIVSEGDMRLARL